MKQGKGEARWVDRLGSRRAFGKEFGFYFICNGKPLDGFKQRVTIIKCMF